MRRGRFVCIIGIDGAGKTTLAKRLAGALQGEGKPARYVYAKYMPIFMRPVIWAGNRVILRGEDIERDYTAYAQRKREAVSERPWLGRLYRRLLEGDYRAQVLLRLQGPLALGDDVVCDRYVHDTLVTDLGGDFFQDADEIIQELDRLLAVFPKPDVTLFVDLPEHVAMARKDDVPDIGYLKDRRHLYQTIAAHVGAIPLDGTGTPDEVLAQALQVLEGSDT